MRYTHGIWLPIDEVKATLAKHFEVNAEDIDLLDDSWYEIPDKHTNERNIMQVGDVAMLIAEKLGIDGNNICYDQDELSLHIWWKELSNADQETE